MKKKYFSWMASAMVLMILISSTGCGVRINGKEYEIFSGKDEQRSNTFTITGTESSNEQELSAAFGEGDQLNINCGVGEVEIKKSKDANITVKAEKKVRGADSKVKDDILENMNIQLERTENVLNIVVKTKDDLNFWDWKDNNFKVYSVSIDFDIEIPGNISKIQVKTGVGDIGVKDVTANLSLTTGVGEIDVENVVLQGDTIIKSGTGDIEFKGNIDEIKSLEIDTGVGEIEFKVPEHSKMSLKASTGVGELSGEFIKTEGNFKFKFEGDINGGGSPISLKSGVGDIKASGY